MKYIEILLPIFRIYQLCGFAQFKIPLDTRHGVHQQVSHFWQIYNGLFLIYLSVLVFFNMVSYQSFLEGKATEMLTYLSYIMICGMRVLAMIVVVESTLKIKHQILFLYQLNEVDGIFRDELNAELDYKKLRRNSLIWMAIFCIQNTILMSLFMVEVFKDNEDIWDRIKWILYSFPLLVSSIKYYQISSYIKLIGLYFRIISVKLEKIHSMENRLHIEQKMITKNEAKSSQEIVYDEIVSMRRIYHVLWKSTKQLNDTFRWSLLLLTGGSFIIIVVNFYRTLVWIITSKADDDIATYFFLSICHTFYFVDLSGVCYHVSQEVSKNIKSNHMVYEMEN